MKMVKNFNSLIKVDINKISLEHQICLMNVNDLIKEKAMIKLREIKSKSDDSSSKAKQYLDGLLKIPFGVYIKEPIFQVINEIKEEYSELANDLSYNNIIEIIENVKKRKNEINESENDIKKCFVILLDKINKLNITKKQYEKCSDTIQKFIKCNTILETFESSKKLIGIKVLPEKKITKIILKKLITDFLCEIFNYIEKNTHDLEFNFLNNIEPLLYQLFTEFEIDITNSHESNGEKLNGCKSKEDILLHCDKIENKFNVISNYFVDVKKILDDSIYGHDNAKKQIERIIGQWINGSNEGYCFGFEGSPGIGKTSMAKKGLANCLKDNKGVSRPFAMIQIGGDSNGSTLHGHNYTYLGSTWGSIVQILMDKQCLNPIIFIDEIDKISKTEHGRELTNILTHLLDPVQNDCFQDKYFNGIDLDLSKALFIVSYNDPEEIDSVLLDRIHRIKFDNLYLKDKIIIAKKYLLPEIYKKMGLENMIEIDDDVIIYIIKHYTNESGVRKLKEKLFDIISEINLIILKSINTIDSSMTHIITPYKVTLDDVKNKYLKGIVETKHLKIHTQCEIGYINGLWANVYGNGGILPIQCNYYPANAFLNLKLTGMQGDVMKESMSVAQTLAWDLTKQEVQKEIIKSYNDQSNGLYGIHIHCPEGATPKDGPSAGCAITTAIYSLLNNKKIKNVIAMTGEITLHGKITAIGSLSSKIIGALHAGVKEILFPLDNEKDFDLFIEKQITQFSCELVEESNESNESVNTKTVKTKKCKIFDMEITFYMVENIKQVFDIVFI
jgi:ATP-dependent Lon protease